MDERNHVIVTIDGPAGAGKSTVARLVARRLSLLYVDSGAMYRAVAWKALKLGVDIADEAAVTRVAENAHIELRPDATGTRVFADGEEVTSAIRTPAVSDASSRIATVPGVREALVEQQRQMGRTRGLVMEGRDIGTVVFPDTPFKFYLEASPRERARRRQKDLEQAGYQVNIVELEEQVLERDRRDMARSVGPLKKAADAMFIDTTDMSIEEVVQTIIARVETFTKGSGQ
ncbi:MAG: (d)CMP kinase [Candidatus Abyssobacteria bacterium SURF_17]|jgi:cytidylate kinase|uniref:Cytidylate kinase n=1 Tax=Candidatus Abyssobacteria bacterium SURF_17 TaxID=2093361 RepID=A0A419EZR4_9BACT|nr:MAG: (d)CMP kinase [Candidatus Abyssubacteria bacterium SURF_17]